MSRLMISKLTRKLLAQHGLQLKKSLGQNFLTDSQILEKITQAAQIPSDAGVIEIGPGIGALTEKLVETGNQVFAIEWDRRLIPILEELFQNRPNVTFIHGDALKTNFMKLINDFDQVRDVYVVANLPYYITSPILIHLLTHRYPFKRIVVMVQKEVANRLIAQPGTKEYGSLSVFVQYYSQVDEMFTVPRHVFFPQPQVDSSVVRFDIRQTPLVDVVDEKLFFQLVRASFSKRRKTLVNSLHSVFSAQLSKQEIMTCLKVAQIDPKRRGETCSLEEFAKITEVFNEYLHSNQRLQLGG